MSVRIRVRLTAVNRSAWLAAGLTCAGFLLALLAQRSIYDSGLVMPGALAYLGAFALLIAAWAFVGDRLSLPVRPARPASRPTLLSSPARPLFVLPAIVLALVAFFEATGNTFRLLGIIAWLASLLLFCFAVSQGGSAEARRAIVDLRARFTRRDAAGRHARWVALALAAILAFGAFFYLYRLDAIPAEMTSDHAEKILDTYDILHGKFSVFFERNTGREPLQFYLNALVVALGLAPLDMLALKLVGAVAGLLTIPGVFLLARELFDTEVGLVAAFFYAVSIFPVALARIGLRYPLAPLFVAWSLFFLVRALRRRTRNDWLLAGLMLGLGLNGYSPFRVMLPLVLAWLALWLVLGAVRSLPELLDLLKNSAIMFGAALLVFIPLLRYLTEHPANFAYRMATRLTPLEQPIAGDPLLIFLDNTWRALGMVNVKGDVVWVNAVPSVPAVDWAIGACAAMGAAYSGYMLLRRREYPFVLILAAILILLLPSTLALAFPEENPSVVRAGGLAPFVMLIAAFPVVLLLRRFTRLGSRALGLLAVGALLILTLALNYQLYFSRYDEQYRRAAWNSTEIAAALREFALAHDDFDHIYVVSAPHWVDYRAVGIHLGSYDFDSHLVQNAAQLRRQAADPAPKLYALKDRDPGSLELLRTVYPDATPVKIRSRTPGRDFLVISVPGR